MLIVHGTKRKVRSLGWVADFCPICRRPQPFEIFRVGLASHIYYISLGQGKLAGHLMRCQPCGTKIVTDESRYKTFAKKPGTDFAALASTTMPNMPELLGERLALEKNVSAGVGEVSPAIRRKMLLEPFIILEGMIAERKVSGGLDKPTSFGCLGTIIVLMAMVAVAAFSEWSAKSVDYALGVGITIFAAGTLYTIVQMALSQRRYIRSEIVPRLAASLKKLRPFETEIAELLAQCKQSGTKIGRAVKPDFLWQYLQAAA